MELASAINSVSIALVDAGIPLLSTVSAVAIAVVDTPSGEDDFTLLVNPTTEELESASSWHTVAYEVKENEPTRLILCESTGKFTKDQLYKILQQAASASLETYKHFKGAVALKLENDFQWRS